MDRLISVVVPVYNTEAYLDKCVQSVLDQTYRNLEVILVNDGSVDHSLEICRKYQVTDSRVKVVDQQNQGVSAARNAGMDLAQGDYLAFLDSDDTLYPEALELLLKDAVTFEADIASGLKCRVKTEADRLYSQETSVQIYEGNEAAMLAMHGISQSSCAKLFRKHFVDDLRFEAGRSINEDGFFMFACYMRQPRIVERDAYIYAYLVRENSASQSVFSDKYLDMLYFLEKKAAIVRNQHPELIHELPNLEVRTRLLFLQNLCKTMDRKYKGYEKECIAKIRRWYKHIDRKSQSPFEKKLTLIVILGLYPMYNLYMHRRIKKKTS